MVGQVLGLATVASMIEHWDNRTDPRRLDYASDERFNREAHLIGPGIDAAVWRVMGFSSLGQYGTSGFCGVLIKDGWKQTTATLTKGAALHELFVLIEDAQ